MDSLQSITAAYVGENAALFPEGSLNELPRNVLEKIFPFLSAYQLHKFTSSNLGFTCNELWKNHVKKRWNKTTMISSYFQSDDDVSQDYHQMYLSKHFFDLLNICCLNAYSPDPSALFRCPLHKLQPWEISRSSESAAANHMKQLLMYAQYAESISLLASQCSWICGNPQLLEQLQKVTTGINLFVIIDEYYEGVRTLVWKLLNEGKLTYVKFSNITHSLSRENLLDLLKICAGIKVEAKIQKYQAFPGKKGTKRTRDEECVQNKCNYTTSMKLMSDFASPPAKKVRIRLDDPDESQSVSVETYDDIPAVCNVIDFTNAMDGSTASESPTDKQYSDNKDGDLHTTPELCGVSHEAIDNHEHDGVESHAIAPGCGLSHEQTEKFSVANTLHQDFQNDINSDADASTSNLGLNKFSVSSYSRLPVQSENEEVASFLNSDDSEEETFSMDFDDEEEFSNTDLYSEALQPIVSTSAQVHCFPIKSAANRGRTHLRRFGRGLNVSLPDLNVDGPLRDVESFVLSCQAGNTNLDVGGSLKMALSHWSSLKKLALIDIDTLDGVMELILEKVSRQQLLHLVLSDVNIHPHFLQQLLHTMYNTFNEDQEVRGPPRIFEFHEFGSDLRVDIPVDYKLFQNGVGRLDFSWTTLALSGFDGLCNLIRYDNALTSLKLNGCFLKEDEMTRLLKVLLDKGQIEVLGLGGNHLNGIEIEKLLLQLLQKVQSIQCLYLNYTMLRGDFVCSPEFLQALKQHQHLRELSLKNNHLDHHACKLLIEVCCTEKISLKSLDIGYNLMKSTELLLAVKTIRSYREMNFLMCSPILDTLLISGNVLQQKFQAQLRAAFTGIVKELETDFIGVDVANLNAEHVAQM